MSVCRVPGPVDPGSPGVPGIPGITRAGYPGRFFSNLGNPGFRRFGSTSFAGFPNPVFKFLNPTSKKNPGNATEVDEEAGAAGCDRAERTKSALSTVNNVKSAGLFVPMAKLRR